MSTDYSALIDAETWAFIRATEAFGTADPAMAAQRAAYDAMARHFHNGRPAGVDVRDGALAGVGVRHYAPDGAGAGVCVLYLHGGGFCLGGLESHDDICAELAAGAGVRLVSADYRLAPEHPHPAAFDDTMAVARALLGQGARLILAGDSAGACLAAAAALALRGQAGLAGLVLIYPGLARHHDSGSALAHAEAPLLSRADLAAYARVRFAGAMPAPPDATAFPIEAADLAGLPRVDAFAAECDPLADDAGAFVARARADGVPAEVTVEQGLVHGHLRARHGGTRARAAFGRIAAALARQVSLAQRQG